MKKDIGQLEERKALKKDHFPNPKVERKNHKLDHTKKKKKRLATSARKKAAT